MTVVDCPLCLVQVWAVKRFQSLLLWMTVVDGERLRRAAAERYWFQSLLLWMTVVDLPQLHGLGPLDLFQSLLLWMTVVDRNRS